MKGTAYTCCQRGIETRRSVPEISGETMATETLGKQQEVIKHHVMTAESRRENPHVSATLTVQEKGRVCWPYLR